MIKYINIFLLSFFLVGCNGEEIEKLKVENDKLRSELGQLRNDNDRLRETAEYHFRLAQDMISAKDWDSAISSLKTVIAKYPNHNLLGPAKDALVQVEIERASERERQLAAARAAAAAREKEVAQSGEPISYGVFYAKTRTGLPVGKRYRFTACLSQTPCLSAQGSAEQLICSIEAEFDDTSEYERWLSGGKRHCGTIVAAMLWGGSIGIYRLH